MATTATRVPPACRRPVTWGQHLRLTVDRHLRAQVDAIHTIAGKNIGTRTTFAKLLDLDAAPAPGTGEYERAYALLLVAREDPADWGIDEELIPPALKGCRDLLFDASGWLEELAAMTAA